MSHTPPAPPLGLLGECLVLSALRLETHSESLQHFLDAAPAGELLIVEGQESVLPPLHINLQSA